jgi:bis(5'-nucleosyl)-tetraphosphatase (symmetrical)
MATYAIGDVQGCYRELANLLEVIEFDRERDHLWFTGDLVNRGPQSLEVLHFVKGLGDKAVTVLGNHDLHLLAVAFGRHERLRRQDTLSAILAAPDREELLHWLRHCPCFFYDAETGFALVHAGLPPQWDLSKARACAGEVEDVLRDGDYTGYFDHMYGDTPVRWSEDLRGWERLRFITNCLTRLRFCDSDGRVTLKEKGPSGSQPVGFMPWFEVPGRQSRGLKIVFGHWAALQLAPSDMDQRGVFHVDTGCYWGGSLTAMRLSDRRFFSVPSLTA